MGHKLIKIYTEVRSAKNSKDRPEFNEALEKVKKYDGLIALKLDRVARNTRDVLILVEDVLEPLNKALVLLDLNVDTSTPTGKLILTVMAAVAQLERDTIRDRTQGGREAKARGGGYAYGSPPYGWKTEKECLIPDEDEQRIIRMMRNHRRSGKSLQEVADYLNGLSIPTKRGKRWEKEQVKRVLDRKVREA